MTDILQRARDSVRGLVTTPWFYTPPGPDGTIHRVSYVRKHHDVTYTHDLLAMADTGYSEAASWDQRQKTAKFIAESPGLVDDLCEALEEARFKAEEFRNREAALRSANNQSTYARLLRSNKFSWED